MRWAGVTRPSGGASACVRTPRWDCEQAAPCPAPSAGLSPGPSPIAPPPPSPWLTVAPARLWKPASGQLCDRDPNSSAHWLPAAAVGGPGPGPRPFRTHWRPPGRGAKTPKPSLCTPPPPPSSLVTAAASQKFIYSLFLLICEQGCRETPVWVEQKCYSRCWKENRILIVALEPPRLQQDSVLMTPWNIFIRSLVFLQV